MSKERELLERVLDEEDDGISFELSIEIKELLAQPEHIADVGNMVEQEPVVWNGSYMKALMDEVDRLNEELLSLAPPPREPLADEEIFEIGYKAGFAIDSIEHDFGVDYGFLDQDGDVDNEPYFKLVRAMEKAHGITGGGE